MNNEQANAIGEFFAVENLENLSIIRSDKYALGDV